MNKEQILEAVKDGIARAKCVLVDHYFLEDSVVFTASFEGSPQTFREYPEPGLTADRVKQRTYRACMHYLHKTPYHSIQPFTSI